MAAHNEGFLRARDGLQLFWESDVPEQPKAHIGIVHGYGDHCGRYRRTMDALLGQGFAVHAFDYRGHGRSEGRRGYCDAFAEYIEDLDVFVEKLRGQSQGGRLFLLAHSHGGLIAIHYVARPKPPAFAGLLLSAPYLQLALKPPTLKVIAAKAMGRIIPWMPVKTEIQFSQLTRDVEVQKETARDPLYNLIVTPRWFTASNQAQDEALTFGPSLTLPILVLCGEKDPIASTETTRKFFQTIAAQDKSFKEYDGMLHEVTNEIGKEEVWGDISRWISARS